MNDIGQNENLHQIKQYIESGKLLPAIKQEPKIKSPQSTNLLDKFRPFGKKKPKFEYVWNFDMIKKIYNTDLVDNVSKIWTNCIAKFEQ